MFRSCFAALYSYTHDAVDDVRKRPLRLRGDERLGEVGEACRPEDDECEDVGEPEEVGGQVVHVAVREALAGGDAALGLGPRAANGETDGENVGKG